MQVGYFWVRKLCSKLKKNVVASFIGNVVYALSQWLLLIVLAKLGGERILGVYTLALAVVSPVFALANMNLRTIQATDAEKIVHFVCYSRFRRLSSLIAILICALIAAIIYYGKPSIMLAIICLAFYKYFEFQSDLIHGFLQRNERMDLIAFSVIIRGVSNVLVISLIYFLTENLILGLVFAIIKSWTVYYFFDKKNFVLLNKGEGEYRSLSELFQVAWPLGIVVFVNTLNLNIPRYIIAAHYGELLVGVFASISYFIVAGSTLVNAIGQSAMPHLAKQSVKDLSTFRVLSRKIFLLILFVGFVGVLIAHFFGEKILYLVYTESISNYHSLFVQIMCAGVAIYASTAVGCSLTALRDFRFQSFASIVNVLVMTFFSLWLIRSYGLSGAAVSIGITYLVKLIVALFRINIVLKRI